MAEEESGFTFVDKRHAQAEETDEPVSGPAAESASESARGDDLPHADEAPDIYGVLGYCISLLATEAWQNLGLLADPQTGEAEVDLAQAKVAIDAAGDLAARLESAPAAAVPAAMRRDLKTLLNDLRLNYVARRGDTPPSRN